MTPCLWSSTYTTLRSICVLLWTTRLSRSTELSELKVRRHFLIKMDFEDIGYVMKMWRYLNRLRIRPNREPFFTKREEQHRTGLFTGNMVVPTSEDATLMLYYCIMLHYSARTSLVYETQNILSLS
jgi:hypothetical protein